MCVFSTYKKENYKIRKENKTSKQTKLQSLKWKLRQPAVKWGKWSMGENKACGFRQQYPVM